MTTTSAADTAGLTNALVALLQAAQVGLLQALRAVGLIGDIDGQAAWPFARRIAVETLVIDGGLARQLAVAIAAGLAVVLLLACAAAWRRARWPAIATVVAVALLSPWPSASLLLTEAVPTSFHHAPPAFGADAVVKGLASYRAQCAACHGNDGRGETALAATLPTWPPLLSGGLLWKRAEGELLWRIRHGVRSMPGHERTLNVDDTWALIAGLRALAAGESARREATWAWPVRAPDIAVACADDGTRTLAAWRGQRLRIVAANDPDAPREDPRFVTVTLSRSATTAGEGCVTRDPSAWLAYATIAGVSPDALAGTQFIVDRDGWMRALAAPGSGGWSDSQLLCRSADSIRQAPAAGDGDGLDGLIRAMDADPVRTAAVGFAHAR